MAKVKKDVYRVVVHYAESGDEFTTKSAAIDTLEEAQVIARETRKSSEWAYAISEGCAEVYITKNGRFCRY